MFASMIYDPLAVKIIHFILTTMSPYLSILALLILPLCLLILLIFKNPTSNRNKQQLPPSPPKLPFIGNAHQLGLLPHRSLHTLAQTHGPLMLLRLGTIPTLVVSSADAAREVLKMQDHVFANRSELKAARILFKNGIDIGFANGEHWREGRKLCQNHLLGSKLVGSFRHIRDEEVDSLLARISADASSGEVTDLSELLMLFTHRVISRPILGKFSREGMDKMVCDLTMEDSRLLQTIYVGDFFPFFGWLDELSGLGPRTRALAKRWDDFLDEVIADHLHANNSIHHDDDDDEDKNSSFLGVLLSLQKDPGPDMNLITTDKIKVLVHELIVAGSETSFVTLEWAMAELMRNSKAMKKLIDEVRQTVRGEQRVKEEDLSQMRYLKAVLKETLRLHPPGPLLPPREAAQSCRVYGYEVPIKTRVIVNVWSIGKDPQIWEAPQQFRPERFLESSVDFRGHDFGLIPFGAGRRICPGLQFAVPALELALANLMLKFDWQLPDGMKMQNLNMDDAPGLVVSRKERLQLVAKKIFS